MSLTLAEIGIIVSIIATIIGVPLAVLWRSHVSSAKDITKNALQIEANKAALAALQDTFLSSIGSMKSVFEVSVDGMKKTFEAAIKDVVRRSAFEAARTSEEIRNMASHLKEIISINAEAAKRTDVLLTHLTERTTNAIERINERIGKLESNGGTK